MTDRLQYKDEKQCEQRITKKELEVNLCEKLKQFTSSSQKHHRRAFLRENRKSVVREKIRKIMTPGKKEMKMPGGN